MSYAWFMFLCLNSLSALTEFPLLDAEPVVMNWCPFVNTGPEFISSRHRFSLSWKYEFLFKTCLGRDGWGGVKLFQQLELLFQLSALCQILQNQNLWLGQNGFCGIAIKMKNKCIPVSPTPATQTGILHFTSIFPWLPLSLDIRFLTPTLLQRPVSSQRLECKCKCTSALFLHVENEARGELNYVHCSGKTMQQSQDLKPLCQLWAHASAGTAPLIWREITSGIWKMVN